MTPKKPRPKGPAIRITDELLGAMYRQGMLEHGATNAAVGAAIDKILAAWVEQQARDPAADEVLSFLMDNFGWLDDWQADFVTSVRARQRLTPSIVDTMKGMVASIRGRQSRALIHDAAEAMTESEAPS
jgi:hypothetical protein